MEQKMCGESAKIASGFKCEKVLEAVDESIACPTPQKNAEPLTIKFGIPQNPTPQKNAEPFTIKSREGETQIPQKYLTLADLFGHMSCSLRLLRLCKKTPTFQNICRQVDVLSKRKFSSVHLAQMKYILPKGICIDKVLVHDKKSLCMVPDMKITLRYEVVEDDYGESADLALRRYFNSRLIDFFDKHPKVVDIPEALLPEPFSKKNCSLNCEDLHVEEPTCQSRYVNSSTELMSISDQIERLPLPEKFELYPSFRRHFSRKNIADQAEKVQCFSSTKISPSSHAFDCLDNQESEKEMQKGCAPLSDDVASLNMERGGQKESFSMSFQPSVINTSVHMICPPHFTCDNSESPDMKNIADQTKKVQCFSSRETSTSSHASYCLDNQESEKAMQKGCAPLSDDVASLNKQRGNQKESFSMSLEPSVINTPVHTIRPPHSVTCNNFESPDTRNIPCAADSFMTETPAQSAPARLLPISDVKLQNTPTQKSTSCHKPAKRVLDFTLMEGNDGLDIRVDKLESSRPLHEFDSFPESSRGCSEGCNSFGSVPVPQEAHFGFEKITQNQAGLDTQRKKYSPLLDLVNVIHSIFESVNRTPITKEELLQKILMNSLDFVDIREVEEQIESLEKLVPDWICKKSVLIGDMYCINKVSDLDSVRSRLSSNETV